MCFDEKSSLLAFTISYSIAWYLFERNQNYDRWLAAFIIVFSSIQILEAGIWRTDVKQGDVNELLTKLILIFLLLQPLVQSYMGYKYTKSQFLALLSLAFTAVLIWGFIRIGTAKPGQFHTTVGEHGHLVWEDSHLKGSFLGAAGPLYMLGIFVPLLFMKGYVGLPIILIGGITALYSYYMTRGKEFGSLWCFTAVAVSLVALFM